MLSQYKCSVTGNDLNVYQFSIFYIFNAEYIYIVSLVQSKNGCSGNNRCITALYLCLGRFLVSASCTSWILPKLGDWSVWMSTCFWKKTKEWKYFTSILVYFAQ